MNLWNCKKILFYSLFFVGSFMLSDLLFSTLRNSINLYNYNIAKRGQNQSIKNTHIKYLGIEDSILFITNIMCMERSD